VLWEIRPVMLIGFYASYMQNVHLIESMKHLYKKCGFLGRINLQACNSTHKPVVRMFGPKLEGV